MLGKAMANSYHTRNGRTSKRGLFLDGVWHCDCEPRLPADKFQTKNGGKNHGRWCEFTQNQDRILYSDVISSLYLPETTAQTMQLLSLDR